MPTFATPEPIAATVEVAGAQVRVTTSDRTDTVVLVEPVDKTNRSHVKVADKTKVEFADGRLSVKTTASGDKNGSVAITIDLPAGSGLAAYLAYSSVEVDGPVGRCKLHMASGRVWLDRVDALQASVASGEVAIGHLAGRADIDGAAFAMRIGEADGDVTAETASGAIRIGRMTGGRAKLTTGSGDIEVGIAEGVATSIDVDSERGAVHNLVSPQGEPSASDAKVLVFARTRHGDVTVQRAAQEASVTSTSSAQFV